MFLSSFYVRSAQCTRGLRYEFGFYFLQVQLLSDEELRFTSEFHDNRGKNIGCKNDSQTAERISSYNQGLVFSAKPLPQNHLFQVNLCQPISTFCIWT